MAFKNPIATLLFILLHETPFQFARRIVRDWEMRKQMEKMRRWNGTANGGSARTSGEVAMSEGFYMPHDDDRFIPGCDSVLMCERSGRWIELGGEG